MSTATGTALIASLIVVVFLLTVVLLRVGAMRKETVLKALRYAQKKAEKE